MAFLAAMMVFAIAGLSTPAHAAGAQDPFSALVERPRTASRGIGVERFVTAADGRVFLFERFGPNGRARFLCADADPRLSCQLDDDLPSEEIVVLRATRAPRGDTLYKDENGRAVLRMTPYGNATVYWPGENTGSAATKTFNADPSLRLSPATADVALARAQKATALVSAKIGAPVLFEASPITLEDRTVRADPDGVRRAAITAAEPAPALAFAPQTAFTARSLPGDGENLAGRRSIERDASVLADAVARVAEALDHVARDKAGRLALSQQIRAVRFDVGRAPDVRLQDGTLFVVVDEEAGVEGRLSSAAIISYLEENL